MESYGCIHFFIFSQTTRVLVNFEQNKCLSIGAFYSLSLMRNIRYKSLKYFLTLN
ncbi:Hypothetical protein LEPBI_II0215 [Leptospira biflexa serovar Patoc strain 'Patoc 1 (Paris)']|uniref:Uncharacterized protein n=1 Tax=Leptospira biflexa serovar Patoc (strain Patoc 1 / ATCC 23582 / Paris) TaxID=456481 RepID=B0SU64_LEPBP|nr:Hypothetical protein LEPBI_II0215 [Leptospira biflexa serovar Patoc strain 'Patoc 1 (Paris)']